MSLPYTFVNGAGNIIDADQVNANFAAVNAAASAGGMPIGSLADYAGAGDLTDWLLCDGRPISRTTYSALFTVISTTYGAGDGSSTFNIPDLRGRVPVGPDNMGTAAGSASRLSAHTTTRGAVGGEELHPLTEGELPADSAIYGSGIGSSILLATTGSPFYTLKNRLVGGSAHNNVQPYQAINKIIRVL